jgi:hypothetical protein
MASSGSTPAHQAHQTHQTLYGELLMKLRSLGRKELSLSLTSGLMRSAAVSLAIMLIASVFEAWAFSGIGVRTVLVVLWGAGTLFALWYFAGSAIARVLGFQANASDDELALRVGKHFPNIQDKLLNALQLYRLTALQSGVSNELALASFGAVGAQARTLDFESILDKTLNKKALMAFASVGVVTLAAFGIFNKALPSALYRLLHFNQSFVPPAPFSLALETVVLKQGTATTVLPNVLRGENVEIRVRVLGDASKLGDVTLRVRERFMDNGVEKGQEQFDAMTLRTDSAGVYRYQIAAIKRSVEFYAETPWYLDMVRSPQGKIVVVDRPDIRSLSGVVSPPAYTKTPPRSFDENSAAVMTLAGSTVELTALASKSLRAAEIVVLKYRTGDSTKGIDTVRMPMNVADRRATGAFRVNFSGEYFVSITDHNGEHNNDPIRYSVLALPDAMPTITLLQPTSNAELSEQAILPMKFTVSDDYGFSALRLHYRLAESRYAPVQEKFSVINLPLPSTEKAAEIPYVWDIGKLGISPSDRYEFFVEVLDNDVISGPKSARTGVLSARLPSLDEIFKEADKTQDLASKELQNILKEADQMKREMEDVSRELRKQVEKPQADWKEKKRLEEMLKRQEDFSKRVEDLRKNLEQMTEKLQQNQSLSQETLKQYMELQQLMKQVDSPELRKAAQQLQKAMEQMNPQQVQQALQKFQFNEEDFKRSIERTMKILQRLQANQKADELSKRAQELQEKQADVQKQTENANLQDQQKREQMAQAQEELRKDLENLNKELGDLEKLMKDIEQKGGKDMPMEQLKKAQDALKKEQTEQAMQQAQNQMQQGKQQEARQQQQQAQKNLQEFAQQMQQLKQEMKRNVQQEAIRAMQKALQNMIGLSKRQEQLKQQTQGLDYNSTQFRDMAQEQSNALQDMRNIISQMIDLSQKSFSVSPQMGRELGEAMQQMEQAQNQLEERNAPQSSQNQAQAMGAMNRATMQMQGALSQMQGQGPGGSGKPGEDGDGMGQGEGQQSFMERLQQMAQQQQTLNQQMQQMMGQGSDGQQGQRLGQKDGEQLGRMAAQQDAIRRSLEEMNKQQKGSGKRAMGDLDRLAKEMQEIVSDMNNGSISDETLRRQERILSRLLDATRSTRERDFENQRESKSGQNLTRQSPAQIDLRTQEGKMRALQELLQSLQQGYTKDYETLIRKYFEALQKTPTTENR